MCPCGVCMRERAQAVNQTKLRQTNDMTIVFREKKVNQPNTNDNKYDAWSGQAKPKREMKYKHCLHGYLFKLKRHKFFSSLENFTIIFCFAFTCWVFHGGFCLACLLVRRRQRRRHTRQTFGSVCNRLANHIYIYRY